MVSNKCYTRTCTFQPQLTPIHGTNENKTADSQKSFWRLDRMVTCTCFRKVWGLHWPIEIEDFTGHVRVELTNNASSVCIVGPLCFKWLFRRFYHNSTLFQPDDSLIMNLLQEHIKKKKLLTQIFVWILIATPNEISF